MINHQQTCRAIMDKAYEFEPDRPLPLLSRLEIAFHVIFCPRCAAGILRLETARAILGADFLPPAPSLEDAIMRQISAEADVMPALDSEASARELSLRSWVVTGLIVLFSLATSFFGIDFAKVATSSGSSFLLPVGLTIGGVITGYGAIFIGSHLKELSERFGIH
ncbi:hypothetical protein FACS189483_03060 [Spirochaetia bacterium]|nr:hypothetical protein FACS189483_03060 [Spirochaetia bacterium]